MGVQAQRRSIDGFDVQLSPLPAMRSIRMLNRLGQVAGPALASIGAAVGSAKGKKGSILDMDVSKLGDAAQKLFEHLEPQVFESIMQEVLGPCLVNGKQLSPAMFDELFTGKVGSALKVFAFGLEVNYGNFFDALGAAGRIKLEASDSPASDTSSPTGPAGASSLSA